MASATKTVQKHYKKFCSYCKAKGLPESAFTSHFVKDAPGPKGKVCCPELLKNECGYCHEIGHTPRFCPKLKARDARRKAAAKRAKPAARNANGAAPTKVTNLFDALVGYSTPEKPKEAFPALTRAPKKAPAPQGVWGGVNALSVAQLEQLLAEKRAAAAQLSDVEQAFIDVQLEKQSQNLEETAAGEAFFDNDADAEDAVMALADAELPPAPKLVRQSAFGAPGLDEVAPLPRPAPMRRQITTCSPGIAGNPPPIALPDTCDLDADFGTPQGGPGGWGDDGWGSD